MFFWTNQYETPLAEAVIHNDLKAVKKLSQHIDYRRAKNYLEFDGIEIARYLGRKDCLKILEPQKEHRFKVLLRGEKTARRLNANEFERRFHLIDRTHIKLSDYKTFKKALKHCPWKNFNTFSEKEVKEIIKRRSIEDMVKQKIHSPELLAIHSFLYQQKINEGMSADVAIKWIDDVLGYGLFTNCDLKIGDYIGEYVGVLQLFFQFPFHLSFDLNAYCFSYPRTLFSPWLFVIDAKSEGNEMRFINHSSYQPLLVPKIVIDRQLMHVIFVAAANISKGTQLTYDYGEDYWRYREPPLDI